MHAVIIRASRETGQQLVSDRNPEKTVHAAMRQASAQHRWAGIWCLCTGRSSRLRSGGATDMRHSAEGGRNHQRQFKLAMRGYDPNKVDAFLAQLSNDPDLPVPSFGRVMRGYDAEQVDLHIGNVKAHESRPPS